MAELKELVDITPKLTAGARYKKSIAEPMLRLHERRKEEAEFGATQKEDVSRREAERSKKKAEASRAEVQEIKTSPEFTSLRKLEEETMGKAFIPTQDTAQDIASLYSLVNVIGMAMGAGGKQNSMQAMHAMNGMLEGYQKGRGDLYKREKDIFDTSMKTLKTKTDILQRRLKEIADLASKNAVAADQEADVLFAEQGADFLKKYKEKFGLPATVRLWEDVVKAQEKATQLTLKEEEAAARDASAERRHREAMAQRERIAKTAAESKGKGGRGGALNDRYAFNIVESFSQAATDLLNVAQMPKNTVLGTFAGMTGQSGNSLLSSLENVVARKITPEDSRLMQQIVAGLDQNMARALGGGYATSTSKGLIQAYKEQVAQYGDSALAQAMFLSRMKQELGILAKAFKNHPGSREGYVEDMQDYMKALNKAIPFNVSDVIAANRGKKQTVTEKFANLAQTPAVVPLPSTEGAVTEKAPAVTQSAPNVNVADERSRAQSAIAAGKDEAAVKARFKERTGQEL